MSSPALSLAPFACLSNRPCVLESRIALEKTAGDLARHLSDGRAEAVGMFGDEVVQIGLATEACRAGTRRFTQLLHTANERDRLHDLLASEPFAKTQNVGLV